MTDRGATQAEPKNKTKTGRQGGADASATRFYERSSSKGSEGISEIIGKPVRLNSYPENGRAELELTDCDGVVHFIYVSSKFIRKAK